MYYYFSSNYPAALKLNGIYYGTIYHSVKNCKIDTGEPALVEVCPLTPFQKQSCLILDDSFLKNPPKSTSITDLKGGYMIKFTGGFYCEEFNVFAQEKYSDCVVTVFSENGYKLSIETPTDFYAENLQFKINSAKIERINISQKSLLAISLFGDDDKILALIYQTEGKITKLFSRSLKDISFDGQITTVEELLDIAKHKITSVWSYDGRDILLASRSVITSENFNLSALNDKIISYAFLEELLVGGDYASFLGDNIKENAQKLSGFFGDFIGVFPPPVFRDINEVGLIYPDKENIYSTEYFKFQILDKKIINIVKS